ncbi:type II toxin-antitoxin system VapC family toxin [Aquamicrobium sp. LC103]|uniref:type II toxin-antitoxin system VapC family toxin n=1 Tax=Aquamicrobium sp. LC103 TaxID=1120658 RepID=UPI00063EA1AC|nr:type II toxin-antitoxin system VapC family toxin [Aquamicrobium sp. LC103]TKT82978.1 type II toxin-antitoxin system VapC family toxin [Aquamicrobium sp. LC103]
MTRFLLDTSVLSAFAPERSPASEGIKRWMAEQGEAETLFIPSIAVAEIERDVRKLRRAGGDVRADRLGEWLDGLIGLFGDRIAAIDANVARVAGAIDDAATAKGRNPGLADVLIAAIAKTHGMTLLTTNGRHFQFLEVDYANPFEKLPG